MTHSHSECSVGATGSCLKAALTPWNVFDQKARELNTPAPSQDLGMPDCPEGAIALQVQVQVQGWAVGGEKAQGPAVDMPCREDALDPQHLCMSHSRERCSQG